LAQRWPLLEVAYTRFRTAYANTLTKVEENLVC
jgi:hypothetical protein